MERLRLAGFLLAVLVVSQAAWSQTVRYVAPDGQGSNTGNNCSQASSPCATIAHAADQSQAGDVIQLQTGTYTESFAIDRNLSLVGSGMSDTIIQAHPAPNAASARVIAIVSPAVNVQIRDLTVRHGRAQNSNGGGIRNLGQLSMQRVRVALNEATGQWAGGPFPTEGMGGGIYSPSGSSLMLDEVLVELNEAGTLGGAITLLGDGQIENSLVQNNSSIILAGGIGFVPWFNGQDSELIMKSVVLSNNQGLNGGGLIQAGGRLDMEEVSFLNNQGSAAGLLGAGGLSVTAGGTVAGRSLLFEGNARAVSVVTGDDPIEAEFVDLQLIDNVAADYGGGMLLWAYPPDAPIQVTIDGLLASGNSAGGRGGALMNAFAELTISGDCSFENNHAGEHGGALFNGRIPITSGESTTQIEDGCDFLGNSAGEDGGALYNDSGTLLMNQVRIEGSSAGGHGGGIFNQANLVVQGGELIANQTGTGGHGGGIHNTHQSLILLTEMKFHGNQTGSGGHGGGLFNGAGTQVFIIGADFSSNLTTGTGDGGGAFNSTTGVLAIQELSMRDNQAHRGGGVRNSGNFQAGPCVFEDNVARTTSGGAILNWSGTPNLLLVDCQLRNNVAETRGGGLFNQGQADLRRVALVGNTAENGGGINHAGGSLELTGGAIIQNHASVNGGGVRTEAGGLTILDSMIAHNTAGGSGAGIRTGTHGNTLALRVWWGTPTGPQEPVLNPGGQGNSIDGDVSYLVWMTGLNLLVSTPSPTTGSQALVEAEMLHTFGTGTHPWVEARFTRTGANPGSGAAHFTADLSRARHQWTGFNPGADTVQAEVWYAGQPSGLISGSGAINWSGDPIPDQIFSSRFQ